MKKYIVSFFTAVTIIMNLLMVYVVRAENTETFSNWFAIVVVVAAFLINRYAESINQQRQTRPEFYGILFMFGLSLVRLLNRFTTVPFAINSIVLFIIIGAGIFFIVVAISRINVLKKK